MKKYLCILLMLCMVSLITGCGSADSTDNCDTDENAGILQETDYSENGELNLITADEFLEYYNLTEADVADYDLEGMIDDYSITSDDLPERDWYFKLKNDARLGIEYGCNMERLIRKQTRPATAEDDFSTARYIVYEVHIDNKDETYTFENVVIDIEEKKIYYLCNLYDYFDAEVVKDMDDETFDKIISILEEMELPEWENNINYERYGSKYYWELFVLMNKQDVIRYTGSITEEDDMEAKFDDFKTFIDEYCN